jgi:hypothetical protein
MELIGKLGEIVTTSVELVELECAHALFPTDSIREIDGTFETNQIHCRGIFVNKR